jgi:hypothetical protein
VPFLLAWSLLDVVANVRYPGKETRLWYFLPSLDTVALLGAFALLGALRRRVPRALHVALAALFVLVRFFRVADGISARFLHRTFNLYVSLSLLPELPRLLSTTMSPPELVLTGAALLAAAAALGVLCYGALRLSEQSLTARTNVRIFAALVGVLALASLVPRAADDERFAGAFASSGAVRLISEAESTVRARSALERKRHNLHDAAERLRRMPTNLARLAGVDVVFLIIESYGESVLEEPTQVARIRPELSAFQAELGARGYTMVSSVLDSPVFGGGSSLAHATLNTGVAIENPVEYELLREEKPPTLADFFGAAGHRTVLVRPGSRHVNAEGEYLRFDQEYFGDSFDYRGPDLGWGKMPDQFVLDFVARRELGEHQQPRFLECALISSHTPWLAQPTLLDDWSRIGDGSVLTTLPIKRHATHWSSLDRAGEAYLDSIAYDLQVLRRFLASELHNDALVVILGDHQPPGGVTGASHGHGVPVHVLSRRAALVAPFVARGYSPGMWPVEKSPRAGMDSFLFAFLRDFSGDLRQTSVVGGRTP